MENIIDDPIKVYVKVNASNDIVEVASSIFLKDTTGWTYIDSGFGDKYAHAQSQFFNKTLIDENGHFNYKFINGKIVNNFVDKN